MSSSDVSAVTSLLPQANEGFITTLSTTISSGATTVPLTSFTGLTNGTTFVGIIEPGGAKEQTFTGIVNTGSSEIDTVFWTRGSNVSHTAGVTIVDYVTGTAFNMLSRAMGVGHTQTGAHKASLPLTTPQVTTSINDANGNEVIKTPATASATNEVTITNAPNGTAPKMAASGSSDTDIALNLQGKGKGSVQINGTDILAPFFDHVVSGVVITADSVGVNKNYSISSGVVCIGGNFLTVAAVSAQTVGASKDRYVDLIDNGDGTAVYVTNEVNNNAASQALTAGNMRAGIVVAGATTIATTASINQGQEDRVLPIASSIAYAVTDSLGNLICPRDPNRKVLGYRQTSTAFNSTQTATTITGLSCPVIVPTGRKIKTTEFVGRIQNTSGTAGETEGQIQEDGVTMAATNGPIVANNTSAGPIICMGEKTPTAGLHTYTATARNSGTNAAGFVFSSGTGGIMFIRVELS